MGLVSTLTGGVTGAISDGVQAYFKHGDEKLTASELKDRIAAAPNLLQAQIDAAEADQPGVITKWRDGAGWTCVAGFAWHYVIGPAATWGAGLAGINASLPTLDTGPLVTLLLGMLGLGGMHLYERVKSK